MKPVKNQIQHLFKQQPMKKNDHKAIKVSIFIFSLTLLIIAFCHRFLPNCAEWWPFEEEHKTVFGLPSQEFDLASANDIWSFTKKLHQQTNQTISAASIPDQPIAQPNDFKVEIIPAKEAPSEAASSEEASSKENETTDLAVKDWRHDQEGLNRQLQPESQDCHQPDENTKCCWSEVQLGLGPVRMLHCHFESSDFLSQHLKNTLDRNSKSAPEWLDNGIQELKGHLVVLPPNEEEQQQDEIKINDLVLKSGLNYFLKGKLQDLSSFPLMNPFEALNEEPEDPFVDLNIHIPSLLQDFLDLQSAQVDFGFPGDLVQPNFKLPLGLPFPFEQHAEEEPCNGPEEELEQPDFQPVIARRVILKARGLAKEDFNIESIQNGQNSFQLQENGCPVGFKLIETECFPETTTPELLVMDYAMKTRRHENEDLKEFSSSAVLIQTIDVSQEPPLPIPFVTLNIKISDKTPISVYLPAQDKFISLSKQGVTLRTNVDGKLILLLPPLFDDVLEIKPSFLKKPELFATKDLLMRMSRLKKEQLQEFTEKPISEQGLQNFHSAFQDLIQPMLQHQIATPSLMKRDFDEPNGSYNLLLGQTDHLPSVIKLDFTNSNNPVYTKVGLEKRGLVSDLLDDVKEGAQEFRDNILELTQEANHFLIEKSKGKGPVHFVIRCFYNTGKEIGSFIVKTMKHAWLFLRGIFEKIGASLDKMVEKISFAFEMKDIYQTGRFLAMHLKKMMITIQDLFQNRMMHFSEKIQKLQRLADDDLLSFMQKFSQKSVAFGSSSQPVKRDLTSDHIPKTYFEHIFHHQSHQNSQKALFPELPPDEEARKISQQLMEEIRDHSEAEENQEFKRQVEKNSKIFSKGVSGVVFGKLIEFLRATVHLALKGTEKIYDLICQLMMKIFRMFDKILNYHIQLPLVTPLFEKWIMQGNGKLSSYNLFALLGAIPATISYKLEFSEAPMTPEQVDVLVKSEKVNDYLINIGNDFPEVNIKKFSNMLSYCIGHVFVAANAAYSTVSLANTMTVFPIRFFQSYFMSTTQYLMQITSLPAHWEQDQSQTSKSYELRMSIWTYSLSLFFFHRGNPTIFGLLMPSSLTGYMTALLTIPKFYLLIVSLVTDIHSYQQTELQSEKIKAAWMRFSANFMTTLSQFLQPFVSVSNPGLQKNGWNPFNWAFDAGTYVFYYLFPPLRAAKIILSLVQDLLLWVATGIHSARLYYSMSKSIPFLN